MVHAIGDVIWTGRNSATALLVLSSILWGSSFVSIKIGLSYLNAFEFASS